MPLLKNIAHTFIICRKLCKTVPLRVSSSEQNTMETCEVTNFWQCLVSIFPVVFAVGHALLKLVCLLRFFFFFCCCCWVTFLCTMFKRWLSCGRAEMSFSPAGMLFIATSCLLASSKGPLLSAKTSIRSIHLWLNPPPWLSTMALPP